LNLEGGGGLWVTFAFALLLASVHLLAPKIRDLPVVLRHAATSFGGLEGGSRLNEPLPRRGPPVLRRRW
jgi:hypothetical protein